MTWEVQGQALLFGGMFLSAVLGAEEKAFLKTVKPEEYYPGSYLTGLVEAANKTNPNMVRNAGKSWGQLMKPQLEQAGAKTVAEALIALADSSTDRTIRGAKESACKINGPGELIIHEYTGLPPELFGSTYEGVIVAWGGSDAKAEVIRKEGDETVYKVTWKA